MWLTFVHLKIMGHVNQCPRTPVNNKKKKESFKLKMIQLKNKDILYFFYK